MARKPNTLRQIAKVVKASKPAVKKTSPIPKNIDTRFMFAKAGTKRKTA